MKSKVIVLTFMLLICLTLFSCKRRESLSENSPTEQSNFQHASDADDEYVSLETEQSTQPYLGDKEVIPLFANRNTIGEWVNDIKVDAEYILCRDEETNKLRLDVRPASVSDKMIKTFASFYVEDDTADARDNDVCGIYTSLSDDIKQLKVSEVISLQFENMGIYFNVRNIVKGSSASDVKRAFLDMKREVNTEAVPYQDLYVIEDVYPNLKIDPKDKNTHLISGFDSVYIEQNGYRMIYYFYTEFDNNENDKYCTFGKSSCISFVIDENEKVVGLHYST